MLFNRVRRLVKMNHHSSFSLEEKKKNCFFLCRIRKTAVENLYDKIKSPKTKSAS